MADKAQGYDYVGYHNYAKRRYSELVGGEWRLTFSVSIVMLCYILIILFAVFTVFFPCFFFVSFRIFLFVFFCFWIYECTQGLRSLRKCRCISSEDREYLCKSAPLPRNSSCSWRGFEVMEAQAAVKVFSIREYYGT